MLAKALYAHALDHYNDGGWDVIVECWSLDDIADRLATEGATNLAEAIEAFDSLVDVWADREWDAINSAF